MSRIATSDACWLKELREPMDYVRLRNVCDLMRVQDREEIYACRRSEDPAVLADEIWAARDLAYTAHLALEREEGLPVAFIGVWPSNHAHMASAAMFGTAMFDLYTRPLTAIVRDVVIPELLRVGVRRVEARAMAANSTAVRWMRHLGAREECSLPGYGKGGQDFLQFAWSFGDVLRQSTKAA